MMQQQYSQSHAEGMNWPILAAVRPTPALVQIALDRPVCVVGARAHVSFPLTSPHVSKGHALIVHEAGGVYVRDLVSMNKTFVNKRAVRETWLLDRDVIQFGTESFICRSGFGQPSERQPAPTIELWLIAGGGASTQVFPLGQETFLIGSRHGCDLVLDADDIACAHAIIFVRDGKRYLRNLSPWENTLVDGRYLRQSELHGDERVHIGQSRLEFRVVEDVATLTDEPEIRFADETALPWDEPPTEASAEEHALPWHESAEETSAEEHALQ